MKGKREPSRGPDEPVISERWLRWFSLYTRGYIARHFHGVRLSRQSAALVADGEPAIVYLNHASWWDPLVCLLLGRECFPRRAAFAPMETAQLQRYRIFRKLGMFGVEPGTARGAATFLRVAEQVLEQRGAMLWLTPQARFADAAERPLLFAGGLARLARRAPHAWLVPLAIEYVFWNERMPEVLLRFGPAEAARSLAGRCADDEALSRELEIRLARTMDSLREQAILRDAGSFDCLLRGRGGITPGYDLWRWARALFRGEAFRADHGTESGG